jgi:hypothetical protein
LGNIDADELRHICGFLGLKFDLFDLLESVLGIEVANIEGLLPVDFVAEFREILVQLEGLNLSILFFYIIGDLVGSLGSQPLISPLIKLEITLRMMLVVASLQA